VSRNCATLRIAPGCSLPFEGVLFFYRTLRLRDANRRSSAISLPLCRVTLHYFPTCRTLRNPRCLADLLWFGRRLQPRRADKGCLESAEPFIWVSRSSLAVVLANERSSIRRLFAGDDFVWISRHRRYLRSHSTCLIYTYDLFEKGLPLDSYAELCNLRFDKCRFWISPRRIPTDGFGLHLEPLAGEDRKKKRRMMKCTATMGMKNENGDRGFGVGTRCLGSRPADHLESRLNQPSGIHLTIFWMSHTSKMEHAIVLTLQTSGQYRSSVFTPIREDRSGSTDRVYALALVSIHTALCCPSIFELWLISLASSSALYRVAFCRSAISSTSAQSECNHSTQGIRTIALSLPS